VYLLQEALRSFRGGDDENDDDNNDDDDDDLVIGLFFLIC